MLNWPQISNLKSSWLVARSHGRDRRPDERMPGNSKLMLRWDSGAELRVLHHHASFWITAHADPLAQTLLCSADLVVFSSNGTAQHLMASDLFWDPCLWLLEHSWSWAVGKCLQVNASCKQTILRGNIAGYSRIPHVPPPSEGVQAPHKISARVISDRSSTPACSSSSLFGTGHYVTAERGAATQQMSALWKHVLLPDLILTMIKPSHNYHAPSPTAPQKGLTCVYTAMAGKLEWVVFARDFSPMRRT